MKHDQVLRIKSLTEKKKRKAILSAAKHNLRELPPEPHIDPLRSGQNRVLHGHENADEVARQAKTMMAEAGIEPRENAVLGIEILVCLPITFDGDAMAFFSDSLTWVDEFFQVPVLSAIAHFDEACPHMHVVLLPILDGRLQGSKVMGDLNRIQAMQTDFYSSVGARYGLRRKAAARLPKDDRRKAASQILDAIIANPALLSGGQVKNLLLDLIAQNPEPFTAPVGMAMPEPAQKKTKQTFVGIMTKPQKPERKQSSIGFQQTPNRVSGPKKANPYALLGVSDSDRAKEPVIDALNALPIEPATTPVHETNADSDQPIPANAEMPAPRIECESNDSQEAARTTTTDTITAVAPFDAFSDAGLVAMDDGDFERVRDDDLGPGEWDADRGEFIRRPAQASRKAETEHAIRAALTAVGRYH